MARVLAWFLLVSACGGEESEPAQDTVPRCPTGQLVTGGGCMPVGIQGCAEMFIEDDGLCHPSDDKCPLGTIPKFDEGCIPAGISNCAPDFLEADGHCYPSPDKCAPGTFPVPSKGCLAIDGEGCGSGTWGNIADAPGTAWVDPSYTGSDGDGSQFKPFSAIAQALGSPRVALAAGTYAEPLDLDLPVEIVGRCPSMVHLSGAGPTPVSFDATVLVLGTQGVVLRNLRIGGAGIGILARGSSIELDGVHVSGASTFGLAVVLGASLHAHHTLIEGTLPTSGMYGRGVDVASAELALSESALIDNSDVGLLAAEVGASVTAIDSVIARTKPRGDLGGGRGVSLLTGAMFDMQASALLENHEVALNLDLESRATLTGSLIARSLPQASDGALGRGMSVQGGAAVELTGSALLENREVAFTATDANTTVKMTSSLIARTQPRESDGFGGRAVNVQGGAQVELSASALLDNRAEAIYAAGDGTKTTVRQSLIARTLPQASDLAFGAGAIATLGAQLELEGSAVRDSATAALLFSTTCRVQSSLLEGVSPGRFHVYACPPSNPTPPCPGMEVKLETYDGIADGLVAGMGSMVDMAQTLILDVPRAAVLFHESGGTLRGISATGDRFGLVLQGQLKPDWQDPSNVFAGGEQPVVTDGNLPVPVAPPLPGE
ncbi:MAG TPA: hypothetical protein VFB62_25625 [Polyangiaceae bacterium]|nr:hypothetical protein [Polyangiaceae bacterium]